MLLSHNNLILKQFVYQTLIKNKINLNDELEIITPNFVSNVKVTKIVHPKKGEVDVANTNDEINLTFESESLDWQKESSYALIRTRGMKEF